MSADEVRRALDNAAMSLEFAQKHGAAGGQRLAIARAQAAVDAARSVVPAQKSAPTTTGA